MASRPNSKRTENLLRLIWKLRQRVTRAGTTSLGGPAEVARFRVLSTLAETGAVSQAALARQVGQHPAGISRIVDGLEKHSLVQRKTDKEDARRHVLVLTGSGKKSLEAQRAKLTPLAEPFEGLPPAELERLEKLLERLVN
jgi:DNA-binding MarR family transcriptional regulator